MTASSRNSQRVADQVDAIRAEYADEEAEAAEAEVAERTAALDVPLNLRIDKDLDAQLKRRAARDQIPVSALVRRILREATTHPETPALTVEQVEQIARCILTEASRGASRGCWPRSAPPERDQRDLGVGADAQGRAPAGDAA